jgi:hypothetical protein
LSPDTAAVVPTAWLTTSPEATASPPATRAVVPLAFSRLQEFIDADGLHEANKQNIIVR